MADQDMERTDPRRGFDFDEVLENQMVETSRTSSSARRRRSPNGAEDAVSGEVVNSTSARNPGNDRLNNRIFFRLFQLGNELQRQAMQQLGITTVQWAALGALSQDKFASGIPFGQLGDYLIVTRQNLDGVISVSSGTAWYSG